MYKKPKVGPDVMDVVHPIILNHHLHTHLTPCRHSYDIANVPFLCGLYNFIEFLIPVFDSSDVTAGFIKTLKPERAFFCQYAAKIAGIPAGFPLLKICCAANHEKSFRHCVAWKLFIVE